jgi:hypothetical protein
MRPFIIRVHLDLLCGLRRSYRVHVHACTPFDAHVLALREAERIAETTGAIVVAGGAA